MKRQPVITILLVPSLILLTLSNFVFASSENWVEVTRFTGNESTQTGLFTLKYQWRIRIEVVPNIITHYFFGDLLNFSVTIYPQGDEESLVRLITMENGNWTDTTENGEWTDLSNGTSVWSNIYEDLSIQDKIGKFYFNIKAELVDRYLIIVEQNKNSDFIKESNWVEVLKFTESESPQIEQFNVDFVDWRIKWEYTPRNYTVFTIVTRNKTGIEIDRVHQVYEFTVNPGQLNGTSRIFNMNGTFYLSIDVTNAADYTVIVEQNIESIPEFPSLIILPLFIVVTLVGMINRTKLRKD